VWPALKVWPLKGWPAVRGTGASFRKVVNEGIEKQVISGQMKREMWVGSGAQWWSMRADIVGKTKVFFQLNFPCCQREERYTHTHTHTHTHTSFFLEHFDQKTCKYFLGPLRMYANLF
jgi:hypothetical protein